VTPVKKKRRRKGIDRPAKPFRDFPLFFHGSGRFAKKIRGKTVYFGYWRGDKAIPWEKALEKYEREKADLHAGRVPVDLDDVFTVEALVNKFLAFKRARVDSGELSALSWQEYYNTAKRVEDALGWNRAVTDLKPDDFEKYRANIAKKWGPHRLAGEVQRIRSMFKYAFDAGYLDRPVRVGPGFVKPTKARMRMHRAKGERKLFEREEVLKMLDAAGPQMRCMILLGLNCGFGNHDCGTLPLSAVDLQRGVIDFARPKTGISRRCFLWPETVEALREVLTNRPAPKKPEAEGRVFVTKYGGSWAKPSELRTNDKGEEKAITDNPVSKEMRKLLDKLNLNGRRNFYCLRHTFATIAGGSRDQVAVDCCMGHVDPSQGATYREMIEDERLQAVVNHVHKWIFASKQAAPVK
jgi:integrase